MGKRLLVFLFIMLLSVNIQGQGDTRDFQGWNWFADSITFTYPLSVAEDAVAQFTAATITNPETIQIVFQDYNPELGWLPTGAALEIMPTMMLSDDLQLSIAPDAVEMLALEFQNGAGQRFLTPMDDTLIYHYQGRTHDDLYLVMATFPVITGESDVTTLDTLINSLRIVPPQAMWLTNETDGLITYADVAFRVDPELVYRVEADTIAPVTEEEALGYMFGAMPGQTIFTLVGYPAPGRGLPPQIIIMPVDEFPDASQIYGGELARLQALLAAPAALTSGVMVEREVSLPILPPIHAAQILTGHVGLLDFQTGNGLRYIAHYAQGMSPLTPDDLFYTFTGISTDGTIAVAAHFPLIAEFLPEITQLEDISQSTDPNAIYRAYQAHLDSLLPEIEAAVPEGYTPSVDALDVIIMSITTR